MDKNYDLVFYLLQKYYSDKELEDLDDFDLFQLFYEQYGIDEEALDTLLQDLLPLCQIAKSELTDKVYQGFGIDNIWLLNKEVKNEQV